MEVVGISYGISLVYFAAIWYILWPFGTFCGHCVYFMVVWYVFPRFGMLSQEKSGNPAHLCLSHCPVLICTCSMKIIKNHSNEFDILFSLKKMHTML
jgi:hypothetical protein